MSPAFGEPQKKKEESERKRKMTEENVRVCVTQKFCCKDRRDISWCSSHSEKTEGLFIYHYCAVLCCFTKGLCVTLTA